MHKRDEYPVISYINILPVKSSCTRHAYKNVKYEQIIDKNFPLPYNQRVSNCIEGKETPYEDNY